MVHGNSPAKNRRDASSASMLTLVALRNIGVFLLEAGLRACGRPLTVAGAASVSHRLLVSLPSGAPTSVVYRIKSGYRKPLNP